MVKKKQDSFYKRERVPGPEWSVASHFEKRFKVQLVRCRVTVWCVDPSGQRCSMTEKFKIQLGERSFTRNSKTETFFLLACLLAWSEE